jgi:hypothetical protein
MKGHRGACVLKRLPIEETAARLLAENRALFLQIVFRLSLPLLSHGLNISNHVSHLRPGGQVYL